MKKIKVKSFKKFLYMKQLRVSEIEWSFLSLQGTQLQQSLNPTIVTWRSTQKKRAKKFKNSFSIILSTQLIMLKLFVLLIVGLAAQINAENSPVFILGPKTWVLKFLIIYSPFANIKICVSLFEVKKDRFRGLEENLSILKRLIDSFVWVYVTL